MRVTAEALEALAAIVTRAVGPRLLALELLATPAGLVWLRIDLTDALPLYIAIPEGDALAALELVTLLPPGSSLIH